MSIIQYFPQKYPGPGTGNLAFDQATTLPVFQIQGAGIIQKNAFIVREHGILYVNSVTKTTDLTQGGLIAGQFIGQPLSQQATSNVG